MRARLEAIESKDPLKSVLIDNTFITTDGIASCNGRLKVIYNAFESIQPNRENIKQLVHPTEERFNSSEGAVIEGINLNLDSDNKNLLQKHITEDQIKFNPIWRALARGDEYLLSQYAKAITYETQEKHKDNYMVKSKKDLDVMSIHLIDLACEIDSEKEAESYMASVYINGIDNPYWSSCLHTLGSIHMESLHIGLLYHIGAIAKHKDQKTLEQKASEASKNKAAFEHNGTLFLPVNSKK